MARQGADFGVFRVDPENYGAKCGDHLFEQYKLYVELTSRISARRTIVNTFFLTCNTLLLITFGALHGVPGAITTLERWYVLFGLGGMVFCSAWWWIVKSFRQISAAKFQVIHLIEARLPLAMYDAEWKALGEGLNPRIFRPMSYVEGFIPAIFGIIYTVFFFIGLWGLHKYLCGCL